MYKVLNEKEIEVFVNKYFKEWGKDIVKVSVISYNGVDEYLINDAVLYSVCTPKYEKYVKN